jgi:hypothetical protein
MQTHFYKNILTKVSTFLKLPFGVVLTTVH